MLHTLRSVGSTKPDGALGSVEYYGCSVGLTRLARVGRRQGDKTVTQSPEWMVVAGGLPREPEHGNLDDLTTLPGPYSLLQALFFELCGVHLNDLSRREVATAEDAVTEDGETRDFIIGDDTTGFRQSEQTWPDSAAVPMRVAIETHGLPEIALQWRYTLSHMEQLGYCAFRHDHLQVAFEAETARHRFEGIWRRVFDTPSLFEPTDTGQ